MSTLTYFSITMISESVLQRRRDDETNMSVDVLAG